MTVGQLIGTLSEFDDDTLVVLLPQHSNYVEQVGEVWDGYADLFRSDTAQKVCILEANLQVGHKPD